MLDFTYEELGLIGCVLDELMDNSREIAADRTTTKENRGQARRQVKAINSIMHKLNRELTKYPAAKPFEIINY